MAQRCPVCGQKLPQGMDAEQLHSRIEKIRAKAASREAERVRREERQRYRHQIGIMRHRLRNRALKDAQAVSRRDKERAVKEIERELRGEIDIMKREHALEKTRMKKQMDEYSRRLEQQTAELTGELCEMEVFSALKEAFPADEISRIGKGKKGADVLQRVMIRGKEVGRIVYECKNALNWSNVWVSCAKSYRVAYDTPWVVIASKSFPRRERWFVVEKTVPVIDSRLTVKLAEIVRGAVAEIGHLRTSHTGRNRKAHQMFQYILSDAFARRFKSVAEAASGLRDLQKKERQWHADTWAKQTRLYDEIDDGQCEIASRIHAITEATGNDGKVLNASARFVYRQERRLTN